jgi:hypothetical protein
MWNAKAVNTYLRNNTVRTREVFTPAEMGNYQTLNEAGRVLKMDRTYSGAEAQRYNLAARGLTAVDKLAGHTAAGGAGVLTGGLEGGAVGYAVGKAIEHGTTRGADKLAMRDVEKRIRKL